MWGSVKMWGNFASFFVSFHRRFVISKSNFKFGRGRTDILEITLLAMNQINNIRWIAREFLPNKICFTRLCAREGLRVDQEVLTKIASGFVTSETPRWWQCNRLWWALSTLRRCQNFFEVLRPEDGWNYGIRWKKLLKFWRWEQKMKMLFNQPINRR